MLNKKAFSVLEIIFAVVIIAIIASIAIPKIFQNTTQTYIVKAKSEIALIRKAIKDDYNYQVMHQISNDYIERLDNALEDEENQELFDGTDDRGLLQYPLISTSSLKNESGRWIKLSNSEYEIVLHSDIKVLFTYDNSTGKFECDDSGEYCMELMQ